MPKEFLKIELLVLILHQQNYIYEIMYKQTFTSKTLGIFPNLAFRFIVFL